MSLALSVRNLSKSYTIHHQQRESTLAETLLLRMKSGFRSTTKETFWALKDLSFDVQKGEVLGIIGRNGAGKSTLLKILSRITEPTTGQIDLYGRVGSLLEVGTGFHPELSGRENIFLNGAILGMTRHEIKKQFDAIVDFAGVEKFLDTPVKRYSSGMYVRLAFAVAAHLRSEILIVDEVLAVGDAEFQKKCLGKMQDVAHDGRTVLFVSHNMQSVKVLCSRAMFLEHGTLKHLDSVDDAIHRYVESFVRHQPDQLDAGRRPGTGDLRFTRVETSKDAYTCDEPKEVRFSIERKSPVVGRSFVSAHIVNAYGAVVAQCDSRLVDHWIDVDGTLEGRFTFKTPWLKPGDYRVDLFLCSNGILDRYDHAATFHVIPLLPYAASSTDEASREGVVLSDFCYE